VRVVEQAVAAGDDGLDHPAPGLLPRATESMAEILALILDLIETDHAYVVDDVCYFDTSSFADYGALSGNTLEAIRSGAGGRVDEANQAAKRHPADFMLWKHDPAHLMKWRPEEVFADRPEVADRATRLGLREGYPGWHVECSAMARNRLGDVIDIHSGGEDLIFPHHECEIAQSRCASGEECFARYWVHARFLRVEGEKMSKSRGNFYTARQVLERGFTPGALRLALVGSHYRQNANFTGPGLTASETTIGRWRDFLARGSASRDAGRANPRVAADFAAAMNSDLNVAEAVAVVNAWVRRTSSPTRSDAALMRLFDDTLGVLRLHEPSTDDDQLDHDTKEKIETLVRARAEARRGKDFSTADRLRDELDALGVEVVDTAEGSTWKRKAEL
jgi:cysteinyl-tRNA synthetase